MNNHLVNLVVRATGYSKAIIDNTKIELQQQPGAVRISIRGGCCGDCFYRLAKAIEIEN